MVKAHFVLNSENRIIEFELKGHALNNIKGRDVVCAAISGQIALVELGILGIVKDCDSNITKNEGFLHILCSENVMTQTLVQSFYLALKAIERDYKNNLVVNTQIK